MSLISALYDAIFTETPSDVSINERSFVSVMLDSKGLGKPFELNDFKIHIRRGESMVLTRLLLDIAVKGVLSIIWFVYQVYNVIHYIATFRWRGTKPSSGINLIIGSVVFISTIIALLYILAFLIKDVVLSPNNARINDKGVITVDQPCLETHSFFLLNSATYWTSTGIQVSEGDMVYITASGSMYSDVDDMHRAVNTNRVLKYSRSIFGPYTPLSNDTSDAKFCLYGRNSLDRYYDFWLFRVKKPLREYPRYGSLLYQICPNHQTPIDYNIGKERFIRQMDFSRWKGYHFTAKKSGVLYLTFNDILLDTVMFDSIVFDNGYMKGELDSIGFTKNDCINNSRIWFQDNLGEVLVNVRIEKNIWESDLPWYKKVVVYAYRKISFLFIHGCVAWIIVLSSVILLFVFDGLIVSNIYKRRMINTNNSIKNE